MRTYTGIAICNRCSCTDRNMIEVYWASGNAHYCQECWPKHGDYYEDDEGRQTWKQIGNYYAPCE
jgi:hypothetical protein